MNSTVKISFNQREFSGAFGDIGTDLPLLVAMILASGLDGSSVFIVFGFLQILTGFIYKIPMPVQPLKAMATIVISQKILGPVILGAGLAIGIIMFFLSVLGLLDRLGKLTPKVVVRGLQFGLGVSLCLLACKEYVNADGFTGYLLTGISFLFILLFMDNKKIPVAVIVIFLGFLYSLFTQPIDFFYHNKIQIHLPIVNLPSWDNVLQGFLILALPQIPLSIGNSILSTKQITEDLFPERKPVSLKKIGITYSIMNLISSFFSGVPCCHGSGGLLGHYNFGGRTGGSVIIYGLFYVSIGFFWGKDITGIISFFPLPILGVLLFFEGISLISLIRDIMSERREFLICLIVGAIAFGVPYGFLIAMVVGTSLYYAPISLRELSNLNKDRKDSSIE